MADPVAKPQVTTTQLHTPGDGTLLILVSEIVAFQPNLNDPKFSGQPRKYFDPDGLRELADSIRIHGQAEVITVKPITGVYGKKWELINGERRLRALTLAGCTHARAIVEHPKDKKEQHLRSLLKNYGGVGHTPLELSNTLQEQVDTGQPITSLPSIINRSLTYVNKILSLQRLHSDLKPLLDPPTPKKSRIRISEGAILTKAPRDRQKEFWEIATCEPTRGLIVKKLNALVKPYLPSQSDKWGRKDRASKVAVGVRRRLNALTAATLELGSITKAEWEMYLQQPDVSNPTACKQDRDLAQAVAMIGNIRQIILGAHKQVH